MTLRAAVRPGALPPTHWRARYDEARSRSAMAETVALRSIYHDLAQHYLSMHLWLETATARVAHLTKPLDEDLPDHIPMRGASPGA